MKSKITILAPANELPAEGAEPKPLPEGKNPSASDLLDTYASMFGEAAVTFEVSSEGSVTLGDTQAAEEFLFVDVGTDDNGDPIFSLEENGMTTPSLDLAGAVEAVKEAFDADDGVRQLVENLGSRIRSAIPEGNGAPVPLVRWHKNDGSGDEDEGGIAQLLGVWLADDAQLAALKEATGGAEIIFEETDVEGRGLRQTVAALAVLGVMVGSAAKADAGFLFFKSKAERAAEQRAKIEAQAHPRQAPAVIVSDVIAKARSGSTQVIVDVSKQRAFLVAADGDILLDTPISTARSGKHTPRGTFKITQRVRTGKTSTIYGCALPYWMRLGDSAIGLHVGDLPGHPASAGCVRLPSHVAPVLFDATRSGTTVKVVDSWQPRPQLYAAR